MIERLSSGQGHLDTVLGGGLAASSINLIAGAPGTGKTMLAAQYLFHNASADRPGVYLATTTEPLDKMVRYGQELAFFDRDKIGTVVLYESLYEPLASGGLQAVLERLIDILRDVRPGLIAIDSFKAFRPFAIDDLAHRRFVSELAGRLSAVQVNTFWVGEYASRELGETAEAAVADSIIVLRSSQQGQRTLRYLHVEKLRGGRFQTGEHAYRLSEHGLSVFPRLADPLDVARPQPSAERISLGSSELDGLISGGVWAGTSTLVIGPSGAGKTMLALDFLTAGARAGRRGVFATLQETSSQLARVLAGGRQASFDNLVEVHRRSPVDMYVDEWVHELLQVVEQSDAELLVVDSLSDLRLASPDETRFEEYVYSLGQRCARMGTTVLLTLESRPAFAFAGAIGTSLSHVADNIVLIGYHVDGHLVRRAIHVLKSRGSAHDQAIREFVIGADGIAIGGEMAIELELSNGGRPLIHAD
jgi:circadian clock protein KaiC